MKKVRFEEYRSVNFQDQCDDPCHCREVLGN